MVIVKSGLFKNYYREWLKKPSNQQTWVNFKTFWTDSINEWDELNKLTAKGTNFGAHAATHKEENNNLILALDNLAMAAATDKATNEKLPKANKRLTAQLEATITTIQRLTEDNQRLLRMVDKNAPQTHTNTERKYKVWDDNSSYDPDGYCWTQKFKLKKIPPAQHAEHHARATDGIPPVETLWEAP